MSSVKERYPHVFVERDEDPRKRVRTVPMQVLSLGFSRTGTMTMKAALEILGIPTWHWVSMAENPPDMTMWVEALQAKYEPESGTTAFGKEEFDGLLSKWGATTDQPAIFFAEDLMTAYPEAKVVLVERDTDRWFKSFSQTVIEGSRNPFIPIIELFDPVYIGAMSRIIDVEARLLWNIREPRRRWFLFNNHAHFDVWKQKAKDFYEAHNRMIKEITPKERLLVFNLDQGWQPLCTFLNKPIPDVPFPRVNESAAAEEMIKTYVAEGYKRTFIKFAKRAAPVLVAAIALFIYWR